MSPGNAVRMQATLDAQPLEQAALLAWDALRTVPASAWPLAAVSFVLPSLTPWRVRTRLGPWRTGLVCLGLLGTGWCAMVPAAMATGAVTPHVWNIGWYATYAAILVAGMALGSVCADTAGDCWRRRTGWMLLAASTAWLLAGLAVEASFPVGAWSVMLISLVLLRAARGAVHAAAYATACVLLFVQLAPDVLVAAPSRCQAWRERDALLRAAEERGDDFAVVPPLPPSAYPRMSFFTDLTGNRKSPAMHHIAAWYHLSAVWIDHGDGMPPALRARWQAAVRVDAEKSRQGRRFVAPNEP